MLSGLFSLNNVYTHLRVVEKLTPQVEHYFGQIRLYAVEQLKTQATSYQMIELTSLQLVQALRYEKLGGKEPPCALLMLLIERAAKSRNLFNNVHWHLYCEWKNIENVEQVRWHFKQIYLDFMAAID